MAGSRTSEESEALRLTQHAPVVAHLHAETGVEAPYVLSYTQQVGLPKAELRIAPILASWVQRAPSREAGRACLSDNRAFNKAINAALAKLNAKKEQTA